MTSQEKSALNPSGSGPNSSSEVAATSVADSLSNDVSGDSVAEVALIRALAEQLALPLSAEQEQAVTQNWRALAAIAQPLMQLDLPEDIEPAPRFEP